MKIISPTGKKWEQIGLGLVLGLIPPVVGLLACWWSSVPFLPDRLILLAAGLGFGVGLIVDSRYLKSWVARAYDFNLKIWLGIYGFYSVCVFGFFMGVPLFNVALAVPAGWFIGRKLARHQADDETCRQLARRTCLFTTLVLALVCLASATIALSDPYTGANLKGMFRLGFTVTPGMIGGLIVAGGAALLALQWWLTATMIRLADRWGG